MSFLAKIFLHKETNTLLKKCVVSLLMVILTTALNNGKIFFTPFFLGFWLFYAISTLWQNEAMGNNKPQYKIVIKNSIWVAGIIAFYLIPFLFLYPDIVMHNYGLDVITFHVFEIVVLCLWSYSMIYIDCVVTGILTIYWLTRSSKEKVKQVSLLEN